ITEVTGLTSGLVGVILVAIVTSLPEAVTTVAAVKIGAFDLAIGNLFGSNIFNMVILAMIDGFYTQGSLLAQVNPTMVLAGMIGLVMTALAGLGNLAGVERRLWVIEVDALAIILAYGLGMWFLIQRGLVH
ncbi:MAG: sodium:calcium antiporter, partial [Chloroflexi bacterium]|nr:sodium:calcium antiporter [Chloroflexota bacterium]